MTFASGTIINNVIVGNLNISEDEIALMNFVWGNDSSGD
jgi:hypothetical protein